VRIIKIGTDNCDVEFGGRHFGICTGCLRQVVP
jgi:hypothetical protein